MFESGLLKRAGMSQEQCGSRRRTRVRRPETVSGFDPPSSSGNLSRREQSGASMDFVMAS